MELKKQLVPGIWYREEYELDATTARAIIVQAKTDEIYEGAVPDEDEKALKEAQSLVELAQEAWDNNMRGPQVSAILHLAQIQTEEDEDKATASEFATPVAVEGKVEPEWVPEEAADSQPEAVQTAPGVFIGNSQPDEPEDGPDPEALAQIEPWEGYASEKVGDVLEALRLGIEVEEDADDLLAHVWLFESAHKERVRVLNAITDHVNERRGKNEAPPEQVQEAPALPQDYAPEEATTPPETPPKGGGEATDEGDGSSDQGVEARSEAVDEGNQQEEGSEEGTQEGEQETREHRGSVSNLAAEADAEPEQGREIGEQDEQEDESKAAYRELVRIVKGEQRAEHLHYPEPPTEPAPELPYDWNKLSDEQVRSLHSIFSSFAYRVGKLVTEEEQISLRCKQQADEMARELTLAAAKYDDHNKERKVAFIEAEVESSPDVKAWRRRQRRHEANASAFRQQRDGYHKLVEALSRHETMRDNEWVRAGGRKR